MPTATCKHARQHACRAWNLFGLILKFNHRNKPGMNARSRSCQMTKSLPNVNRCKHEGSYFFFNRMNFSSRFSPANWHAHGYIYFRQPLLIRTYKNIKIKIWCPMRHGKMHDSGQILAGGILRRQFFFAWPHTCPTLHIYICGIHNAYYLGHLGHLEQSGATLWRVLVKGISNSAPTAPTEPKSRRNIKQMTTLDGRCTQMVHLTERIYRYRRKCAGWLWGAHAYRGVFPGKLMLKQPPLPVGCLQNESEL